jgi:hypothetical protein
MHLLLLLACAPVGADGTLGDTSSALDSGEVADTGEEPRELYGKPPAEETPAPEFAATNRDGAARSRADVTDGPTVIWFYPSAGTYG